ncbi:hypothetical protein [Catenuloplanes atrovinosus]|uniref:Uncharacterized protein n=1 Tax=Catenuloplanes atrovinosus TaxID=137266 RepID=A0AAE3YRP0_9ACTN|nr:hypothetical protein [Catenuloplanes atrovinosus]MDR7276486.1 hypothetical protein [Catenuloplanes atrovinosus]
MTDDELISRYVADVIALLPRRQRADVARELRDLLREELTGPDDTRTLLTRFGHPAEVAARYTAPVALIDPADTRRFLLLAGGGALLVHLGGALLSPHDLAAAAEVTWPVVLGWLGVLVAAFAGTAWWRRRHTGPPAWKPRPPLSDRVNRVGRTAAVAVFALGTLILVDPAAVMHALGAAPAPFAYHPDFLLVRGPVLLTLLILGLALQTTLAWTGRWTRPLHLADLIHSLLVCAAMAWAISAGPVFSAAPTDRTTKAAAALIILITLADLAFRARRLSVAHALAS